VYVSQEVSKVTNIKIASIHTDSATRSIVTMQLVNFQILVSLVILDSKVLYLA